MSDLQIFKNEKLNFEVKMKLDNGEDVFDAETVAKSLGIIEVKNNKKYVMWRRVNQYLKIFGTSAELKKGDFISESMVYKLAFKANNEVAENFQDWLAIDVIPQIRKTGVYIPNNEEDDDASIMAKALMIAQKTINKKDELLKSKTRELEDKNRFIKQISASQNSLLVREVAKIISSKESEIVIGEKALYQKLRDWGLIFKNKNEPKQQYVNQGLFEVVEGIRNTETGIFTYQTMRITGKGQTYILKRLLREHQLNRHLA